MRRLQVLFVAVVGAVSMFCVGCATTQQQIDPEAQQILKEMSTVLATAKSFSFETSVTMDEQNDNGRLVRVSRHGRIVVSRPDKVYAEAKGDDGDRAFWYNGKGLTFLNRETKEYATIAVPGSIDKMFDFIMEKYDLSVPLEDLLYADPYGVLTEKVETGVYLGRDLVLGQECDHLLFTQANVDWQIWIAAGAIPLPRKVVITQKNEPGGPQFVAIVDQWELSAAPTDDVFVFRAPAGAKALSISQLLDVE